MNDSRDWRLTSNTSMVKKTWAPAPMAAANRFSKGGVRKTSPCIIFQPISSSVNSSWLTNVLSDNHYETESITSHGNMFRNQRYAYPRCGIESIDWRTITKLANEEIGIPHQLPCIARSLSSIFSSVWSWERRSRASRGRMSWWCSASEFRMLLEGKCCQRNASFDLRTEYQACGAIPPNRKMKSKHNRRWACE
jgi:hypothetical protein